MKHELRGSSGSCVIVSGLCAMTQMLRYQWLIQILEGVCVFIFTFIFNPSK